MLQPQRWRLGAVMVDSIYYWSPARLRFRLRLLGAAASDGRNRPGFDSPAEPWARAGPGASHKAPSSLPGTAASAASLSVIVETTLNLNHVLLSSSSLSDCFSSSK